MRVKCEYCDSYVDAVTNCPNCGAALPVPNAHQNEVTLHVEGVEPFRFFEHIANAFDVELYRNGIITANELRARRNGV